MRFHQLGLVLCVAALSMTVKADILDLGNGVLGSPIEDPGYVQENSRGPGTLCIDVPVGRHPSDFGALYSCKEIMAAYRQHRAPISNR